MEKTDKTREELENDEDKMYSYIVHYSGKVYIEARNKDEAYDKFMQGGELDLDIVEVIESERE